MVAHDLREPPRTLVNVLVDVLNSPLFFAFLPPDQLYTI